MKNRSSWTSLAVLWGSTAVGLASPALAASPANPTATEPPPYTGPAPHWPQTPVAPAGAPNVLLILTDDVGFGAPSAFGGPVPTPTYDSLAAQGLSYNSFNTTAMCSPTRASLLTGRAPHNVGMGELSDFATGFDGYNSVIPMSAATVAEVLKLNGYSTAMFGKGHITPNWELSQAGPFDRWPTGLGFEYFYGFLGSDTDQINPLLVENTRPVEPPHGDPSYFLDRDLADRTIGWLKEHRAVAPKKPFFVYYATGAAHAPNQAPAAWMEKFRGKFDQGWDKLRVETLAAQKKRGVAPANTQLTPRPESIPAWSAVPPEQQKVFSRFMEAYAAQLASADDQIGRIISYLKETGQYDNTLIIFIQGDNGATVEGGPNGTLFQQSLESDTPESPAVILANKDKIGTGQLYNILPAGWGWALNSPFQWNKQVASHFGGIRNGLVMSWPDGIRDAGKIRSQFHHVSDIYPTILDAAGIKPPAVVAGVEQKPIDGVSMAYTFKSGTEPSHRKVQAFSVLQNLGIYKDGWFASTTPDKPSWEILKKPGLPLDHRNWELYDLSRDFSQAHDLARRDPVKLKEMQAAFWQQAAANQMLPIHSIREGVEGRPSLSSRVSTFTYPAGVKDIPAEAAPKTIGASFTITADVEIPAGGGDGVIVAQGGRHQGQSFYLSGGRPTYYYNGVGEYQYRIQAAEPLAPGKHVLKVDVALEANQPHSPAAVVIFADGKEVARGRIERTMTGFGWKEGLSVGLDTVSPVSPDYGEAGNGFSGEIATVVFDVR